MLKRVGEVAYKLELPPRFAHVHPVFHVSLLKGHTGSLPTRPDPIVVEGEPEFEIKSIVGHAVTRRGVRYQVRWKGYTSQDDVWLGEADLGHARELLRDYKQRVGLA